MSVIEIRRMYRTFFNPRLDFSQLTAQIQSMEQDLHMSPFLESKLEVTAKVTQQQNNISDKLQSIIKIVINRYKISI